jgi:hypothetical protein
VKDSGAFDKVVCMKKLLLLLLCLVSLQASCDSAVSYLSTHRQAFFHALKTDFMEIVEEGTPYFDESLGDYPWIARVIQSDVFKWNPSGKPRRQTPACDSFLWQQNSLSHGLTAEQWTHNLESYMRDCHNAWETGRNDIISNAVGTVSLKLHPSRYPFGRHVVFHLPNGIKLKGLLAMKTDAKKRPLVIFRTGLFSNTQEFYPERFLFLQLFEQSPFHVLVLESSSGSEFLKHNDSYSLGGFDEGLQNFFVAQKIQSASEPISKFISEVHMMGLSMGGHGALFAALLNQVNSSPRQKPVLQSALAFCPLLNMQDTLDYHMSQGFTMDVMNYWASRRLTVLKDRIPGLKDETFIPQFFDWIREHYKGPLIAENGQVPGVRLPPGIEKILNEKKRPEDLFWRLNNFWPWYENVKTPVIIFSTRKDPIVSWFINSGRIEDHRMQFQDSNLKFFSFENGYHCSLPVAYDWGALSTLFQTYFLKMSPSYEMQKKEVHIPMDRKILEKFADHEPYLDLHFSVKEKTAGVDVQVRFDEKFKPSFWEQLTAPKMEAQLPLSEMEFPIESVVQNKDEASLLRRWSYQNIHAHLEGSDLVFNWMISR